MKKGTYSTPCGDKEFLTVGKIRSFDYITLGVQNEHDVIYIDINKRQAVEIFKKHDFVVNYLVLEDNSLHIN